jgi:dTDP-4-dehydrorhamnose reductase
MRILITGASGLLGINLALEAASQHDVFGQVNSQEISTNKFTIVKADLLEPGAVERLFHETHPDWVVHCAALANLELCENDPVLARELNTEVPRNLAIQCRKGGARLLHVSTDAVFDGETGGYSEIDTPNPLSTYARSKLNAEYAVTVENPNAIIARVNFIGWSLTGKRSLAEFFYTNLSTGNEVMGFIDVDFCPLLVNDLAQIFLKMLGNGLSGIYHVVSSDHVSKYEFGVQIAHKFNFNGKLIQPMFVNKAGLKAPRSPKLTLKVDKLTRDLGEVLPTVSTGIDKFYTLHQQGYPQVIRGMSQ